MRFYPMILAILLSGCDILKTDGLGEQTTLRATCYMNGFKNFPKKVTGPVTFELKSYLTIAVKNKDGSETVEMTFPKSKCGAK